MFDRFQGRFVLPLIRGGEKVLVSYPIGVGALEYFELAQQLDATVASELVTTRQVILRELIPNASPEALDADDIRLLAALHNVLLCDHEELVRGVRGQQRWTHCLNWASEHLAKVPECDDSDRALRRHSLLHQLPHLTRQDVIVRTRRGSRRYLGQEPPKRALVWPRLRRVRTNKAVVSLPEMVAREDARALFTEILERSPLTCLLSMPYNKQGAVHLEEFRWSSQVVNVLRRTELCRAVTYRHLDLGLPAVGPALTRATTLGIERLSSTGHSVSQRDLTFGLRYVLNLQLTHLITADEGHVMTPIESEWFEGDKEIRALFLGWFAAAMARADRAGAPELMTRELKERESEYRKSARSFAGKAIEVAARQVDWIIPPAVDRAQQGGQS